MYSRLFSLNSAETQTVLKSMKVRAACPAPMNWPVASWRLETKPSAGALTVV